MSDEVAFWGTILIFTITYMGLAIGKLPGLRIDRTGIALVGASGILASGLLTFDEAVKSIDFATLALLFGMMIVVAFLRESGFFEILANVALGRLKNPSALLAITMLLSGVLSALLVNDVICLALTPLALHLTRSLGLDPKPHLIGLAVASNIGSTATLTGNPQNMIIGELSHISYLRFAEKLAPIAVLSLIVAFLLTRLLFRSALQAKQENSGTETHKVNLSRPLRRAHRNLLIKSLLVTLIAVGCFFAGAPMAIVALTAAGVLLLDRVEPKKIYRQVDWGLLVMFAGLFIVVHAFEIHVLQRWNVGSWTGMKNHPVDLLSLVSATLSNLVSNVPAVLLFKPIIPAMPNEIQETAWLALAMSSTLAGNLTVLGSVANLIVVENAQKEGVSIRLYEYCWVGIPVTILTLALGILWLQFVVY